MAKKSILLINLGSPEGPEPASVKKFLKDFLNDRRVIDLPTFWRWILVNLFIIPFRYKKSAAAYKKIWTVSGSPLLQYSLKMKEALALALGKDYQVELGMRYGHPSIETVLNKFGNVEKLKVIPLFPHYSSAATGSAIEAAIKHISNQNNIPKFDVINCFYSHPDFIGAYSDVIRENTINKQVDYYLFSYHGLPLRHIRKSACHAECDKMQACPAIQERNHYCYRAQCFTTSRLLAEELDLSPLQYGVSFQSRLGFSPWIKPYTDKLLPELIKKGQLHLAVVCPSFVADCLETLEEVAMRTQEQWYKLGGKAFTFIPCLNDHSAWIRTLVRLCKQDYKDVSLLPK